MLAPMLPADDPASGVRAASGRSMLSTAPRTAARFMSSSPDSLTWYFDPLSSFVCSCS